MKTFGVPIIAMAAALLFGSTTASAIPHDAAADAAPAAAPLEARQYAAGWCGVHVTQTRNPRRLNAVIYDAEQNQVGNAGGISRVVVESNLPNDLVVTYGDSPTDDIIYSYQNNEWGSSNSGSHHCSVGGYDGGRRQIDCGFTC